MLLRSQSSCFERLQLFQRKLGNHWYKWFGLQFLPAMDGSIFGIATRPSLASQK
jgi:hypothetical protein